MPVSISLNTSPVQFSNQFSIAPRTPTTAFSSRMTSSIPCTAISGSSIVSTAVGGPSSGGYGSSSAVSQMNQDLLDAQAQNQALMRQQQAGGNTSSTGSTAAGLNADLIQSQSENTALLKLQIAMQRENQVFTSVSNILKTRHDTVKNSIGNIR